MLRSDVVGATDPRKANPGSFRRTILDRADELGLADVGQNANGLHLSAGPLEGMVEVCRFVLGEAAGTAASSTCFGALLHENGLSDVAIDSLAGNPNVHSEGRDVSVFDLTEELNSTAAAKVLVDHL